MCVSCVGWIYVSYSRRQKTHKDFLKKLKFCCTITLTRTSTFCTVCKCCCLFQSQLKIVSSSHCMFSYKYVLIAHSRSGAVFVVKVARRFFLCVVVSQFEPTLFWQRTRLNQQSVVSLADCLLWNRSQIISSQNNIQHLTKVTLF